MQRMAGNNSRWKAANEEEEGEGGEEEEEETINRKYIHKQTNVSVIRFYRCCNKSGTHVNVASPSH
jgi:hypothetical protein